MKMPLHMMTIVLSAFLFSADAYADTPPAAASQSAGSPTIPQACKSELESYCQNITPGGGRLLVCLQPHFEELSSGCAAVVEKILTARMVAPAPTDASGAAPTPPAQSPAPAAK
jgi:Cysteine rich repeat